MGDQVFYFRGQFPGVNVEIPKKLVTDAKHVLDLEEEELEGICTALEAHAGFLDRESIEETIRAIVGSDDVSRPLARMIAELQTRFALPGQDVAQLIADIERWAKDEENQAEEILSAADVELLKNRLPRLLRTYPGIGRQRKARRLAAAIGNPLEDVQILCDLRPVFDEDRVVVQGIVPYTTLRIVCKEVDGLPVAHEAILSEKQVGDLVRKAQAAETKLATVREFLNVGNVPIPTTRLTEREGDR